MNIDRLTVLGKTIAIEAALKAGVKNPKYTPNALLPSGDKAAAIRFKRITANDERYHETLDALTAAGFDTDPTFGGWLPSQCDTAFVNARLFEGIKP